MLGKLIHHDFKATAKLFVILFIFIILLTPITKLSVKFMFYLDDQLYFRKGVDIPPEFMKFMQEIAGTVLLSYYGALAIFVAATFFILVMHFYRSMATKQAYLTHTLPVTSAQLIASKTIVSVIWSILAGMVALLSVFILFVSKDSMEAVGKELYPILNQLNFNKNTGYIILAFVEVILLLLVSITLSYAKAFFAISVGQSFKNYKLLASIGIYYALSIASKFMNGIGVFVFTIFVNWVANWEYSMNPLHMVLFLVMPALILILTGVCAGFLIFSNYMFKKHLNLQ